MKLEKKRHMSRRGFLARGAAGATVLGWTTLPGARTQAATAKSATRSITSYADSLEALRKTDPNLIRYDQIGRVPFPDAEPKRIFFAPDGQLYVAAGQRVSRVDGEGKKTAEIAVQGEIHCMALASAGTLYVGLRDHIEVYDRNGRRRATWDSPAKRTWLTGLAATESDIFACDAGNRIVYRFDRSGKLVRRIGEKNPQKDIPGFIVPSPYFDLELGADNLLWVANPGRHRLEAYTFDGDLQSFWGEASFGVAGFCGCCNPSYFTRMSEGRFLTSEKGLTRVKEYSPKGDFACVVAGPEAFPKYGDNVNASAIAMDVAVDSRDRVFVADSLGNEIRIYEKKPPV